MYYNDFQELKLSGLGFGCMRFPTKEDKSIDEIQVQEMVDYAIAHGVNYFDTAYPYHGGMSEIVIGKALAKYPREQWFLATKYPGHQYADSYDPAEIFEEQLKKCGVDYFDFYLLHNVNDSCLDVYMDPKWGIVDYFVEQKKAGRIRHLGFSCHARGDGLKTFLDYAGDKMEFCQIQLNYLDWTLQQANEKVRLLNERNIPIIVMEPVHGGLLAKQIPAVEEKLQSLRPGESMASWAFRWLQGIPGILTILSGMSNIEQMTDNVRTFDERKPLTDEENALILDIAEGFKKSVPCTACRYCCDGCPMGLNIPKLIAMYNELAVMPSIPLAMQVEALPEDKLPSACIACGQCSAACPQHIDVPKVLNEFVEKIPTLPNWKQMCKDREEAAKRLREQN